MFICFLACWPLEGTTGVSTLNMSTRKTDRQQIKLRTRHKVYLIHSVLNLLVNIHVPLYWTDISEQLIRANNSNTHALPHAASEFADTSSFYLDELCLRTTKEDYKIIKYD